MTPEQVENIDRMMAGLRKDAERYRYLRDSKTDIAGDFYGCLGSELDRAIDKAIAKSTYPANTSANRP